MSAASSREIVPAGLKRDLPKVGRKPVSNLILADVQRKEHELAAQRLDSPEIPLAMPDEDRMTVGSEERISLLKFAGDALMKRLIRHVFLQRTRTLDETRLNPAHRLLQAVDHIASNCILAERSGLQKSYATRKMRQVACAVLQSSTMLWSGLLLQIQKMVDNGFEICMVGRCRKYNESPFRLRVTETGEVVQGGLQQSPLPHGRCWSRRLPAKPELENGGGS